MQIKPLQKLAFLIIISLLLCLGCSTPSVIVTQEQQAGDNFFNQHSYPEAILHYQNMLDASFKLGVYRNQSMEADVHRKMANCYEMIGKYEDADQHVLYALRLDSIENNARNIIEDYRMLGKIDLYQGKNFEAISSLEMALDRSEGLDQSVKSLNRDENAETRLALAQLYLTMGRFNESLSLAGSSLGIFESTNNKRGELESLLTMGSVYINLGDLGLGRALTERSMRIAEEIKVSSARHLNNLASISSTLGEFEDAIRYQERALSDADNYNIAAQKVWFTIRMGDLFRDLGDVHRSLEYYEKAAILMDTTNIESESIEASINLREGDLISASNYFSNQGSDVGAGITYLRMAEIALSKSDHPGAMEHLQKADEKFQKTRNSAGMANVNLQKGIVYSIENNYQDALKSLELAEKEGDFPEIKWQALYQKGLLYEKQNSIPKARDSYIGAIKIIEQIRGNLTIDEFKSSYINNKVDVYDRLISIYLKLNQPILALKSSEKAKARTFYEMLANKKIDFSSNSGDSHINQEQDLRFEIQNLYKQLQSIDSKPQISSSVRSINRRNIASELNQKQEEYNDILLSLKLNSPEYSEIISASPVDPEEVQATLDENTAVLSYWLSDSAIYIWCLTNKSFTQKSIPASKVQLDKIINDARTHIATNATTLANSEMATLYKYLIEPIANQLSNKQKLIILPNKSLHFLPFQALRNSSGRYLVEDYIISYEPSLGVLSLGQKKNPGNQKRFFGAALSDLSIGLNSGLPGTEDELNKILPLFENNLSSFGEKSTETFVKSNIKDYDIIHLATHGFYNYVQPGYSFLLFPGSENDDGRLTVFEVLELDIDSKLVTLSACETGLGYLDRGDEIVGLSRSFLYAGSSAVIVSLWSVADYQTSLLMTNFYSYLEDYPVDESLALAQRDVLKLYPNPFFWSPFILVGKVN